MRTPLLPALAMTALLASPVAAQERYFNFAVTGGVAAAPAFPGSGDYEAQPSFGLTFGALKWGRLDMGDGIGAVPENGLSLVGSFDVIGARTAADYAELTGLRDVDTALELGFGLVYQQTNWRVFGDLRKGVMGHSGVTGGLGADLIFRPAARLTITAGPRVSLGDTQFAETYFGVNAAEAAASGFAGFDAGGGALGAGFEVGATYELNEKWSVNGALGYEKLLGDAADSPITAIGSEDQWSVRIGLSREFTLRF